MNICRGTDVHVIMRLLCIMIACALGAWLIGPRRGLITYWGLLGAPAHYRVWLQSFCILKAPLKISRCGQERVCGSTIIQTVYTSRPDTEVSHR